MLDVDQQTFEKLLAGDKFFKSLYQRHAELNKKVDKAGRGELPLSDSALADMKKERLALKDQMVEIVHKHAETDSPQTDCSAPTPSSASDAMPQTGQS